MMLDFLRENISEILPYLFGAGGVIGLIVERRRRKAEALTAMQQTYNDFVEDFKDKYNALKKDVDESNKKLQDLSEEVSVWKRKYTDLKKQFETYKKQHP